MVRSCGAGIPPWVRHSAHAIRPRGGRCHLSGSTREPCAIESIPWRQTGHRPRSAPDPARCDPDRRARGGHDGPAASCTRRNRSRHVAHGTTLARTWHVTRPSIPGPIHARTPPAEHRSRQNGGPVVSKGECDAPWVSAGTRPPCSETGTGVHYPSAARPRKQPRRRLATHRKQDAAIYRCARCTWAVPFESRARSAGPIQPSSAQYPGLPDTTGEIVRN
jgi:hypothetical protein